MHLDPEARRVLCFGDSNTHGTPSDDPDYVRLPADQRWTGILQRLLGDGFELIEEGLPGRTTDLDETGRPGCNGRAYLAPCLLSQHPLDVVVLMLGTNDLKSWFERTPALVAAALDGCVEVVATHVTDRDGRPPEVVLVSPIHIDDTAPAYAEMTGPSFDAAGVAHSRALAAEIRRVAEARGAAFVDAAQVARAGADGLHLTADSHAPLAAAVAAAIR